jgi:hypothetical protein
MVVPPAPTGPRKRGETPEEQVRVGAPRDEPSALTELATDCRAAGAESTSQGRQARAARAEEGAEGCLPAAPQAHQERGAHRAGHAALTAAHARCGEGRPACWIRLPVPAQRSEADSWAAMHCGATEALPTRCVGAAAGSSGGFRRLVCVSCVLTPHVLEISMYSGVTGIGVACRGSCRPAQAPRAPAAGLEAPRELGDRRSCWLAIPKILGRWRAMAPYSAVQLAGREPRSGSGGTLRCRKPSLFCRTQARGSLPSREPRAVIRTSMYVSARIRARADNWSPQIHRRTHAYARAMNVP